jgi:glycosyltransferase involved in cell wall biosynthesis
LGDVLRFAICDYSGHPFQVQLSRELARRGHNVLHLHFAEFQTPKGRLDVGRDDPATLAIEPVSLDQPFAKFSLFKRRFQEIEIGRRIAARVEAFRPDIVVGCNLPLDALWKLVASCQRKKLPFVFWQQDIYSDAIARILTRKLGLPGLLLGIHYKRIERRALRASAAIVVIADEFISALVNDFGVSAASAHVIENWAPLDDLTPRQKANAWTREQGLDGAEVVLYSGTLGLKHNAGKIFTVAQALLSRPNAVLVVTSEGASANWLAGEVRRTGLQNVRILPFQPFEAYPDVLGGADVLIALLESDAGKFSVPSKVLSYLCAERAIVLSAPQDNLASRIVSKSGAGAVVAPDDVEGFAASVLGMLSDLSARNSAAQNGRRYAEKTFDITLIGDRFEKILVEAARSGKSN